MLDFRVLRAVAQRLGINCHLHEIREQLHLFPLDFQRSVIAVMFGHLRCHVTYDTLNYIQWYTVQPGIITEGMPAAVQIFYRSSPGTVWTLLSGNDATLLFQKLFDPCKFKIVCY